LSNFPTGKGHVSFSEVRTWAECPWRHKLIYIDKLLPEIKSEHLDFGTAVHSSCEKYLKTRELDIELCTNAIREAWEKNGFKDVEKWVKWATVVLNDVPEFLESNFPGWEIYAAEFPLMESIENNDIKFKGFIDGIIKIKDKKNNEKILVLDWKTGPAYGWRADKKRDFLTQAQLVLYKSYIMKLLELDSSNVKTSFIVLKKGAKQGNSIELVDFSAGPTIQQKANKLVSSMISSVRRGFFPKNKYNCEFCDFAKSGQCTR
jgi:hypothetical protein